MKPMCNCSPLPLSRIVCKKHRGSGGKNGDWKPKEEKNEKRSKTKKDNGILWNGPKYIYK